MPAVVNVADFIKIGLIAFVFVFAVNYGLTRLGLDQFKA